MKYIYLIASWLFAIVFALLGISLVVTTNFVSAGLFFLAFLLVLPPFRTRMYSLTNIEIPLAIRLLSILVVTFVGIVVSNSTSSDNEPSLVKESQQTPPVHHTQEDLIREGRKKNTAYFNSHRSQILSDAQSYLDKGNYLEALQHTSKYVYSEDADLLAIYNEAKTNHELALLAQKKAEAAARIEAEVQGLLRDLKIVPAEDFETNISMYQKLVDRRPEVSTYRDKLAHYTKLKADKVAKAMEEDKKRRAKQNELVAKFGDKPQPSAWDGSYLAVSRYLERVAHDPDSIDFEGCTNVRYTSKGWLVGCEYFGNNAFGAKVRNFNWFTIRFGRVENAEDGNAYSL